MFSLHDSIRKEPLRREGDAFFICFFNAEEEKLNQQRGLHEKEGRKWEIKTSKSLQFKESAALAGP